MVRCIGLKVNGSRCTKTTKSGSSRCFIHIIKKPISEVIEGSSSESDVESDYSIEIYSSSHVYSCAFCNISFRSTNCKSGDCIDPFKNMNSLQHNVNGDGYCFWRSLSFAFGCNEESYEYPLKMCFNSKELDEVISKKNVEFWEIPVISRILRLNIKVYLVIDGKLYCYESSETGDSDSYEVPPKSIHSPTGISILYVPGHYRPLV